MPSPASGAPARRHAVAAHAEGLHGRPAVAGRQVGDQAGDRPALLDERRRERPGRPTLPALPVLARAVQRVQDDPRPVLGHRPVAGLLGDHRQAQRAEDRDRRLLRRPGVAAAGDGGLDAGGRPGGQVDEAHRQRCPTGGRRHGQAPAGGQVPDAVAPPAHGRGEHVRVVERHPRPAHHHRLGGPLRRPGPAEQHDLPVGADQHPRIGVHQGGRQGRRGHAERLPDGLEVRGRRVPQGAALRHRHPRGLRRRPSLRIPQQYPSRR